MLSLKAAAENFSPACGFFSPPSVSFVSLFSSLSVSFASFASLFSSSTFRSFSPAAISGFSPILGTALLC